MVFKEVCDDLFDIRDLPLTPANLVLFGITGIAVTLKLVIGKKTRNKNSQEVISRKTCCAKFQLIPHREMVRRGTPFSYQPDRVRAIKFLSKIEGRMRYWRDSYVTSRALPVAKVGLVPFLVDLFVSEISPFDDDDGWIWLRNRFPATYSLLVICCSVFSERKMFTLKSQKQEG